MRECFIIGGGASFRQGLELDFFERMKGKDIWSLNYSYKFMPYLPTRQLFADDKFYRENREDMWELVKNNIPVFVKKHVIYDNEKFPCTQYNITRGNYYNKEKMITEQTLSTSTMNLSGETAISLAIMEGYERIFLCYDEKTQVLTKEGWKLFKNLKKDDLILTRKSDGTTEYSKINYFLKQKYKGDMYQIKNKRIDLLVTPEHKFGTNIKGVKNYNWKTVKDFYKNDRSYIPKTFKFKGKYKKYFYLPEISITKKSTSQITVKKIKMNDWLAFMGLVISEGSYNLNKKSGNYKIVIYQNHTIEQDKYIQTILNRLPWKYHWHKRGWVLYSKQLATYFETLGKSWEKYIPQEFKNLSPHQLTILIDALVFGDGTKHNNKSYSYWTASDQLASDIQEIAFKCGFSASITTRKPRFLRKNKYIKKDFISRPIHLVYFSKLKGRGSFNNVVPRNLNYNKKIKTVNYDGYIYDINVKNHMIFVKRNNVCCWSGNCGFDFGPPDKSNKNTHWYMEGFKNKKGEDRQWWFSNQWKLFSTGVGNPSTYFNIYKPCERKKDGLKEEYKFYRNYSNEEAEIINVSMISNLDAFEKITFEEMFEMVGV